MNSVTTFGQRAGDAALRRLDALVAWRRDALGLALGLLESFALAAAANMAFFAFGRAEQSPGPDVLLAVVFAAYVAARILAIADIPERQGRLLTATAGAGVILVACWNRFGSGLAIWDPQWLGSFLVDLRGVTSVLSEDALPALAVLMFGLAYWRGAILAIEPNTLERTLRSLRFGVFLFALDLALSGAAKVSSPVQGLVFAYVASGMLVLALARQSRTFEERRSGLRPSWLAITSVVVIGLIGASSVVSLVLGFEFLGVFLEIAQWLAAAVGVVLYRILLLIGYAAEFVFEFIRAHMGLSPLNVNQSIQQVRVTPTPVAVNAPAEEHLPLVVRDALNWLVLTLLVLAGAAGLALLFRASRPSSEAEDEGERTSVPLARGLSNELSARWRRRRQRVPPTSPALHPIRRRYRELLSQASAAGRPRQPAETPLEFLPHAREVVPTPAPSQLTDAYNRVRYGEEDLPGDG